MEPQKPLKKVNKGLQTAAKLSGIGIQMGLTIYLGNLLGTWLDEKFATTYLEISVTLVAIFISIYSLIRQANKLNT
ncbi:AtpZ/AtpI family protein [Cellulophaga sp. HaHaR_3_176]|uniref:AtpZ/AtpI family protein n=1 Tax=Cellulophaga sp. HaHaR_3_176 TaxID=1942464 RepID=UPI001C1F7347|nr:AtpZ/AtpI family protein [Cellulophaga sp. HaHaR_3_176]QWX83681.1 AtpZ/AtpI family protein [Cellulophaga sp. HaHaR_3_176]